MRDRTTEMRQLVESERTTREERTTERTGMHQRVTELCVRRSHVVWASNMVKCMKFKPPPKEVVEGSNKMKETVKKTKEKAKEKATKVAGV